MSENLDIKFLSYLIVEYYLKENIDKDSLIIVNPILKDFLNLNPIIKGNALKRLT